MSIGTSSDVKGLPTIELDAELDVELDIELEDDDDDVKFNEARDDEDDEGPRDKIEPETPIDDDRPISAEVEVFDESVRVNPVCENIVRGGVSILLSPDEEVDKPVKVGGPLELPLLLAVPGS
jgi:hypothetical protein